MASTISSFTSLSSLYLIPFFLESSMLKTLFSSDSWSEFQGHETSAYRSTDQQLMCVYKYTGHCALPTQILQLTPLVSSEKTIDRIASANTFRRY
ncbi:hypothetical protein BDZ94DRAFT_953912 [Collybia nuda]|uniref:Uncharacterized protein n=1 Tax=Collybia nuda TaxID=64659 RepID=A0A9P5Y2H9_9AGAR|nr:hypothetical protein BDZ94DRAFT_953912 [Collybia nuda]